LPAKEVQVYTDGACLGNPGPGGFGVVLLYKGHRKELSGGFRLTTNNRMELLAVIKGLEALKEPCRVDLYSDSQYVVNGIEKGWARGWRRRGWRRSTGEPTVNPDLWARILELLDLHTVKLHWVRGHAGNVENERADQLAFGAAGGNDLDVDQAYERYLAGQAASSG
jgi:ribonuclease HI